MTGAPAGQRWDPGTYAANARFVAELGQPVIELLAPRAGERILDLGCGDGVLTERLAAFGCAVVGVDASPEQVGAAQARGLDARVMDGQRLEFRKEFDAVFSNAALHWMRDPDLVIAGVHRALKPGGRFVGEMGGAGNIARIAEALTKALSRRGLTADLPWYFPGDREYRAKLGAAGFAVEEIQLFPRPTPLPGDITGWIETFAGAPLARVPEVERDDFIAELRTALQPHLRQPDDNWIVDYVRLRFRAIKAL
ncbi:MAG TPA: methyltransferase domain-containing protein [Alphaproteobacteria bacterium]|nr:methyltransferase domain-containing protein [Alphaproteobacteria bacterium]